MTKQKSPKPPTKRTRTGRARDNASEQQRRNALARSRGFASRAEERKYGRHVARVADIERLPLAAQRHRESSLRVLSLMRADPTLSLRRAAEMEDTTTEAVVWFSEGTIAKSKGPWRVARADRLMRPMFTYSNGEIAEVIVRGSRKATELSRYHHAVRLYLNEGDDSKLASFAGKSVAGRRYETDLDTLDEMTRRGQLGIEDIYSLVAI